VLVDGVPTAMETPDAVPSEFTEAAVEASREGAYEPYRVRAPPSLQRRRTVGVLLSLRALSARLYAAAQLVTVGEPGVNGVTMFCALSPLAWLGAGVKPRALSARVHSADL